MEKLSLMAEFRGMKMAFPLESVVDTGASRTVIPKALADVIEPDYTGETESFQVGNGRKIVCKLARVRLTLLPLACSAWILCAVRNAKIPPLIGADFLQKKRIVIDYRDHSITWRGKKHRLLYIYNSAAALGTTREHGF